MKMTISAVGDLAKEIPTRINQIVELSNKGYGLTRRLLRHSVIDLDIYDKIVEIAAITCEFWGNLENIWRHFVEKVQPNAQVLELLDELNEETSKIYPIIASEQENNLSERVILTLIQEYFDEITVKLSSV